MSEEVKNKNQEIDQEEFKSISATNKEVDNDENIVNDAEKQSIDSSKVDKTENSNKKLDKNSSINDNLVLNQNELNKLFEKYQVDVNYIQEKLKW